MVQVTAKDVDLIFVSHNKQDVRWCYRFVMALRRTGEGVWYDKDSLGYGVLMDVIEQKLVECTVFIPVFSPAAIASKWVRREMNAAIELHDRNASRIILPVVAKTCNVPIMWHEYSRISGPNDSGLTPGEAAREVIRRLELEVIDMNSLPQRIDSEETAEQTWERGRSLYNNGWIDRAQKAFERACELDGKQARYWNSLAYTYRALRQNKKATAAFERATALAAKESGSTPS